MIWKREYELLCDIIREDVQSTKTLHPQQGGHKPQQDYPWRQSADK